MLWYFIIGVAIFTLTSISMWIKDKEEIKSNIQEPAWWLAWVVCVVFWPVIILWSIINGIILQSKGEL